MRNILFRGKNINTGVWEYGYYVNWKGTHSIVRDWDGFMKTIDPKTLCQNLFTITFNRKRILIFEGDILELYLKDFSGIEDKRKFIVGEFNINHDCSYLQNIKDFLEMAETNDYIKVIGNIHEKGDFKNEK